MRGSVENVIPEDVAQGCPPHQGSAMNRLAGRFILTTDTVGSKGRRCSAIQRLAFPGMGSYCNLEDDAKFRKQAAGKVGLGCELLCDKVVVRPNGAAAID
jgi:hypothetical protein